MGDEAQGEEFFTSRWPEAIAVADPSQTIYSEFGLGSGTLNQVIGPKAILAAGRALAKGNLVGKPVGDVKAMPGAFLIHEGRILWSHDYLHSGDRPDWMAAARAAETAVSGA